MPRPCPPLLRLQSDARHVAGANASTWLCTQTGAVRSRETEQWNIRDALADSAELTTTEQCASTSNLRMLTAAQTRHRSMVPLPFAGLVLPSISTFQTVLCSTGRINKHPCFLLCSEPSAGLSSKP